MKKSTVQKIKDHIYTDLAEQVLFGTTFKLDRTGFVLKADKSVSDVNAAAKKVMNTAPFKTEAHIVKMADYLRKLTCPAIPT